MRLPHSRKDNLIGREPRPQRDIDFAAGVCVRVRAFGTYGIESSDNGGANDRGNGLGGNERTPPPATFRASLRVTF